MAGNITMGLVRSMEVAWPVSGATNSSCLLNDKAAIERPFLFPIYGGGCGIRFCILIEKSSNRGVTMKVTYQSLVAVVIATFLCASAANAQDATKCVALERISSEATVADNVQFRYRFRNNCGHRVELFWRETEGAGRCSGRSSAGIPAGDTIRRYAILEKGYTHRIRWCVDWASSTRQKASGYPSCYRANLPRNCK